MQLPVETTTNLLQNLWEKLVEIPAWLLNNCDCPSFVVFQITKLAKWRCITNQTRILFSDGCRNP